MADQLFVECSMTGTQAWTIASLMSQVENSNDTIVSLSITLPLFFLWFCYSNQ